MIRCRIAVIRPGMSAAAYPVSRSALVMTTGCGESVLVGQGGGVAVEGPGVGAAVLVEPGVPPAGEDQGLDGRGGDEFTTVDFADYQEKSEMWDGRIRRR